MNKATALLAWAASMGALDNLPGLGSGNAGREKAERSPELTNRLLDEAEAKRERRLAKRKKQAQKKR